MKQKPTSKRMTLLVVLGASFLMLVIFGNWLNEQASLVAQGQPPEPRPAFDGQPIDVVLEENDFLPTTNVPLNIRGGGWQEVFTETFESGINSMIWTVFDADGTANGEYKWGSETYTNTTPAGTRSAWAIGDGEDGGTLDPAADGYPPNVDSWLIYGPIDMSNVTEGMVMFDYWYQASVGDTFAVMASTDGTNYSGLATSNGGSGGWSEVMYDLDTYAGEPQLYIAFVFKSDSSTNPSNFKGVFLDDVILAFNLLNNTYLPYLSNDPTLTPSPTPTATPTATPTSQPSTPYVDDFLNPNSGWTMRRQSTGPGTPSTNVSYVEGGRLELKVNTSNHYVLAAPLAAAASTNKYRIETQAQLLNPQDQSGYGIVFGGNWNGSTCPNSGYTSCFTSYYLLEIRWLANNNNPLLVARMIEVTGHDSNNKPAYNIVFDWTEARTVGGVTINPNGVNEWDIQVESNGTISVYIANKLLKTVTGETTYFGQKYFGLYGSTFNESGGTTNAATVRYEYISVVAVQ